MARYRTITPINFLTLSFVAPTVNACTRIFMRQNATTAICFFGVILLALCGCASTPTDRYYQARHALTGVQDTIGIAHDSAIIDDARLVEIDPFIQAARGTLTKSKQYLPDGGGEFVVLMDYFNELILELQKPGINDADR